MLYPILYKATKTTAVLTAVVLQSFGQANSVGVRYTRTLLRSAFVENPSPSNIYNWKHTSHEMGVYALRYFRNNHIAAKVEVQSGHIPWDVAIIGPRSAFGTGNGGDKQLEFGFATNDFSYFAVALSSIYKVQFTNFLLEISAGASLRKYTYGKGTPGIQFALNRSKPYDPTQGPPDVSIHLKPLRNQITFPVSIDYGIRTSRRSLLKVGLMNNIAFKPLSDSELIVLMNGQTYNGKYSPRISFWGFNVLLEYNLKSGSDLIKKKLDLTNRNRKALFIERRGSGIRYSVNYDMRLKKNINSGLGLKAGLGFGEFYFTEVTNDNKDPGKTYISVPLEINYILGNKRHGIETGFGFTPQVALYRVRNDYPAVKTRFPFHIGYRFQPLIEGLITRFAWTPIHTRSSDSTLKYILNNTGISLGYSFR